jgi:hypothetical protein
VSPPSSIAPRTSGDVTAAVGGAHFASVSVWFRLGSPWPPPLPVRLRPWRWEDAPRTPADQRTPPTACDALAARGA